MFKTKSMRPVCGALVYSAEKHIALLNSSKPLDVEDMTHSAYSANIITRSQVPMPIHNCLANIASRIYIELHDPISKIISEEVQKQERCLGEMDNEKSAEIAVKGDSNYADLTIINKFNMLLSPQASVKTQEDPAQDNLLKKEDENCGPSAIDMVWNFFCSLVESITSLFRSSKPAPAPQAKLNLASASLEHTQQTFITHKQFASAAIVEVVSFSVIKMFYGKVNLDWSVFMDWVVKTINGIFKSH